MTTIVVQRYWRERAHAAEVQNERLRSVLRDFDRFVSIGAGAHEYVCSPFQSIVKDAIGEPQPDCDGERTI